MRYCFFLILIILFSACSPSPPPEPTVAPTPTGGPMPTATLAADQANFPLEEGNAWVYQGLVRWQDGEDIKEEDMTWKMEVVEVIERLPVRGVRLKGHPSDLIWYEPGREPSDHFIIQVDQKYYEGNQEAWDRLQDPDDILMGLVSEAMLVLDLPLWLNKPFGETGYLTRSDGAYQWLVTDEQTVSLDQVQGVTDTDEVAQYSVTYRTNPDQQIVDFVSGVGITRYVYVHNGTISEVDMALIEFQN